MPGLISNNTCSKHNFKDTDLLQQTMPHLILPVSMISRGPNINREAIISNKSSNTRIRLTRILMLHSKCDIINRTRQQAIKKSFQEHFKISLGLTLDLDNHLDQAQLFKQKLKVSPLFKGDFRTNLEHLQHINSKIKCFSAITNNNSMEIMEITTTDISVEAF
jgi:hypothetical protein